MKAYQFVLAGLVGACVLVWGALRISDWKTAQIEGTITNVRTLGMDQQSSVAIVDVTAVNPSDIQMMIGERSITVLDPKGIRVQGMIISAPDLKGLFQYFPGLGGIDNEPLLNRVRIQPGESVFAMVAARFEIPKHELDLRQELILRLADVDGSVSEIRQVSEPSGEAR